MLVFLTVACSSSRTAVKDSAAGEVTVAQEAPKPPLPPAPPATDELDRSQPPVAGPAPELQLGEYQYFEMENGMKVYVVQNDKIPRVAYSLQIDRDPVMEGEKAGMISLMGDLLSRGTSTRSKAEIDEAVDFIGASFATSSSSMFGASLTKHSDELLSIMRDVLLNPSFPQDELDKLIQLSKSDLAAAKEDPGSIITRVRAQVVYGADHPYGELTTEETLDNITREDIIDFFQTYWSPKQAYVAVIGDISLEEAKAKVDKYFGDWEAEDIPSHEYALPQAPEQTKVILVDRPQSVQSEIRISYPVSYDTGDPDFFATRLMNQILGGGFSSRIMQNLREDKGYTYGAGSGMSTDDVVARFSGGAAVRNEVTDSAIYEFLFEMERIVEEGVTENELKAMKAYSTGMFARSLESPQTIAGFAINTAVKDLPEGFYPDYLKNLNAVTIEEVNASADKFIKPDNAYIIVVGKAEEVAEDLKRFGPIEYYDADGNKIDKAKMQAAMANQSPESVMSNYIKAIGGEEQLLSIENQKQVWEMSAFGQTIEVHSVKTAKGQFRTDVMMGGKAAQSIISDGEDLAILAGGQAMPMDESTKQAEMINNRMFPELSYDRDGVKLKLTGVEQVEGKPAYSMTVIYPSGSESFVYFDVETGLKVKEVTSVEGPQGPSNQVAIYADYQEVDGILYPHVSKVNMGPQVVEMKLKVLEHNTKVEPGTFELK